MDLAYTLPQRNVSLLDPGSAEDVGCILLVTQHGRGGDSDGMPYHAMHVNVCPAM